jgi:hypothetical protein
MGRLVLFDDVDAATIIEVTVEERPFALAHVVRGINRRTVQEINDEIRSVKSAGVKSLAPGLRVISKAFLRLPGLLRRPVYRALLQFPEFAKQHTGTVLVTSVGMFSDCAGWGFSAPGIHNLSIVIGGIALRHPLETGESRPREVLCLTVSASHSTVDGGPLARFVNDFKRRIETGDLLIGEIES